MYVSACTMQEEQRAERRAAKAAAADLSVVEKSTFASRQQALFTDVIKAGFKETMRAEAQVSRVFRCGVQAGHKGSRSTDEEDLGCGVQAGHKGSRSTDRRV